MVSVPEGLEGLLADFGVGSGVHEQHAKKHHVASNTTCFSVMDL